MRHAISLIQLEYLPTANARKWRKAYTMRPEGRVTMELEAPRLAAQEDWHAWRIVDAN